MSKGRIILITGIMAAGKSTVAQLVAERLPKSIHLRGDTFRKIIVNGREDMSANASGEAIAQLKLRYRSAASVAKQYAAEGFSVVYQDVILGEMLSYVTDQIDNDLLRVFVLNPRAEVVEERERTRQKTGYTGFRVGDLIALLHQETPRLGLWIDSSDQTAEETAAIITEHISQR